MINIKSGSYGLYTNLTFELNVMNNGRCELISRDDLGNTYEKLGFIKYNETICCLSIEEKYIESAYYVYTFCKYQEYKFQISGGDILNKKIQIWHSIEAQVYFKDYARHGYDPQLVVDISEVEEIWEERIPIEGFKFDVEPTRYIKKGGIYLGE